LAEILKNDYDLMPEEEETISFEFYDFGIHQHSDEGSEAMN